MLTPTFHFKILEDFLQVFNEQSKILIEKLDAAMKTHQKGFDIYPFITRCTLDIICGMPSYIELYLINTTLLEIYVTYICIY